VISFIPLLRLGLGRAAVFWIDQLEWPKGRPLKPVFHRKEVRSRSPRGESVSATGKAQGSSLTRASIRIVRP
jgi:hypothetical protein